mmetsp:Transcript_64382/g.188835  ORF Transcript_64382/g.188835 Transcript_64382/m.188835 type:complete len:324 (-) Transcript_64382:490-1461(-)
MLLQRREDRQPRAVLQRRRGRGRDGALVALLTLPLALGVAAQRRRAKDLDEALVREDRGGVRVILGPGERPQEEREASRHALEEAGEDGLHVRPREAALGPGEAEAPGELGQRPEALRLRCVVRVVREERLVEDGPDRGLELAGVVLAGRAEPPVAERSHREGHRVADERRAELAANALDQADHLGRLREPVLPDAIRPRLEGVLEAGLLVEHAQLQAERGRVHVKRAVLLHHLLERPGLKRVGHLGGKTRQAEVPTHLREHPRRRGAQVGARRENLVEAPTDLVCNALGQLLAGSLRRLGLGVGVAETPGLDDAGVREEPPK